MHSLFYKQLRPSNILKFEKIVAETVRVLEEEYCNPFGATRNESCLYNLSSGETLPAGIANRMTKCYSKGLELMKSLKGSLLENREHQFHDSITRNPVKSFKSHVYSKVIAKNNKTATVRTNRGIIVSLLEVVLKKGDSTILDNFLQPAFCRGLVVITTA